MRWMWIDRVVELTPGKRLVAVKHVSMAEEHLHDHFMARPATAMRPARPKTPIMPASLIVEGMAQSGGILLGHAHGFRENIVLAKVSLVEFDREATPGCTLRYTTTLRQMDAAGASTEGVVELAEPGALAMGPFEPIGRVDLMFSHLGQAGSGLDGLDLPDHNFVFCDGFRTLLRLSGVDLGPAGGLEPK